jgi:hypothetical protein
LGSGIKTFTSGTVLTAADVNNYLMKQAIVTCTSGTRPASPTTGQPIFETDTNLIRVWNGSTWYCTASPDYTDYSGSVTFYSNANSGTTISGASVSVSYCYYQKVNTRVHYYGHATINTTTASGFAVGLPFASPIRVFTLSACHLQGAGNYTASVGNAHVPVISAPYNRFSPTDRSNNQLNILTSGDTVHWNIMYQSV